MRTQPTEPTQPTPDESTTVSRDENRVGPAAENQGGAGARSAAHGRHRAPGDIDDLRAGGHPERAPRSLHAVELIADDEAIASNDEWDEPERL